jgi:hypothetical protein
MSVYSRLDDIFTTGEVTFKKVKTPDEVRNEQQMAEDAEKNRMTNVENVISESGFGITEFTNDDDKYAIEVRKGTTTKVLEFTEEELDDNSILVESIKCELVK